MNRLGIAAGLTAGVMLVASSAAHSLLGWKQLSAEIAQTNTPQDLVGGLAVGWHFGGVAMLTFGIIVLAEFILMARRQAGSLRASFLIGLAYVPFGLISMVITGMNPFFLVFIVPGLLLIAASWPSSRAPSSRPSGA